MRHFSDRHDPRALRRCEDRIDGATAGVGRFAHPPVPAAGELAGPGIKANTTREAHHAMVETAKEYIHAGDILQVVPSQRFSAPFPLPSFALYRSLRRLNPSPFLFHLDFGAFQIVGSSPEILVRLRDGVGTLRPLAGTPRRCAAAKEERPLA